MGKGITKKRNFWIVSMMNQLINLAVFMTFASFAIAISNWVISFYPKMPLVFKIAWIIGVMNLLILSATKNWSVFKCLE